MDGAESRLPEILLGSYGCRLSALWVLSASLGTLRVWPACSLASLAMVRPLAPAKRHHGLATFCDPPALCGRVLEGFATHHGLADGCAAHVAAAQVGSARLNSAVWTWPLVSWVPGAPACRVGAASP